MELPLNTAWTYLLAYFLLTEYGIKQWLETNARHDRGWSVQTYVLLRAAHLLVNLAGIALMAHADARSAIILLIVVELLGASELPLAAVDRALRRRAGIHLRSLQALPLAGLVLWTASRAQAFHFSATASAIVEGLGRSLPQFDVDPAALGWYALGFAFLASPANHLVRCFVGKSPEGQFAYLVRRRSAAGVRLGVQPELAAAQDEDPAGRSENTLRAGRAIGSLERWIMLSLTLLGQFSLIGLVLTAKSIARFKRIEQDPEFAEYYLLGTLYSTLIALACGMVLIHV